jgi:hypothetical protein
MKQVLELNIRQLSRAIELKMDIRQAYYIIMSDYPTTSSIGNLLSFMLVTEDNFNKKVFSAIGDLYGELRKEEM